MNGFPNMNNFFLNRNDFFPGYTSLTSNSSKIAELFECLYDVSIPISPDIFFGLNIGWPRFNLPDNYQQYVVSFHTEYLDRHWVIQQATRVYPKSVTLISDFTILPGPEWPDNITFVQQRTIHKQLTIGAETHGVNHNIVLPQYKFSSLSFRVSQYKIFITAFLLKHVPSNDIVLTFHNQVLGDVATWPSDVPALQGLDLTIPATFINFDDQFTLAKNSPVANANWNCEPYQNALVNLTNESYHHSSSMIGDTPVICPGPYFTEKMFKPLLAGRPFISVNQFESIKELQQLGFKTDFGFSHDYDTEVGDFDRITKIFNTVAQVNLIPISDLFDSSIDAVKHNVNHIVSGDLSSVCKELNRQHLPELIARCT
jgi:hypothetical protein